MSRDIKYIGMDVHKEAMVIAACNQSDRILRTAGRNSTERVPGFHDSAERSSPDDDAFLGHALQRRTATLQPRPGYSRDSHGQTPATIKNARAQIAR